jgi:hypothetical protein
MRESPQLDRAALQDEKACARFLLTYFLDFAGSARYVPCEDFFIGWLEE